MAINDFAFACSVDGSIVGYFTYHNRTMLIVQSEQEAKAGVNNFLRIAEPFMEPLISHESIHVIIKQLEGAEASDSLDEVEVIVEPGGVKLQEPLNFIHYSHYNSGIVLPYYEKNWCPDSRALFYIVRDFTLAYCHLIDSNCYLVPLVVVFENVRRGLFVTCRAVSSDTLAQPGSQLVNLILRYHQVSCYVL